MSTRNLQVQFRAAAQTDIDFIIAAIIEAERSGGNFTLYERVFGVSCDALESTLRALIEEDVPGSELCYSGFLLAVAEDQPVGCLATWIEAVDSPPSNIVRANLLAYVLGAEKWGEAQKRIRQLASVDIRRERGTMQIESVCVLPAFRGRRVVTSLIDHAVESCRLSNPAVHKAQILSVVENLASYRAFSNAGFAVVRHTHSDDPALRDLFPGSGRLLWERAF